MTFCRSWTTRLSSQYSVKHWVGQTDWLQLLCKVHTLHISREQRMTTSDHKYTIQNALDATLPKRTLEYLVCTTRANLFVELTWGASFASSRIGGNVGIDVVPCSAIWSTKTEWNLHPEVGWNEVTSPWSHEHKNRKWVTRASLELALLHITYACISHNWRPKWC